MPYTTETLPPKVKNLPKEAQESWLKAYNAAYKTYKGDEAKANATAWAQLMKEGYRKVGSKWIHVEMQSEEERVLDSFFRAEDPETLLEVVQEDFEEAQYVLKRIALLGADIPQVKTLEDINALGENGEIKGLEIFEAGIYRGKTWTVEMLDKIVQNFERLKDKIKPPLAFIDKITLGDIGLGHDPGQLFLKNAGLPAGGWIDKVYRKGKKLIADVVQVPEVLQEAIRKGRYKRVSSEIYPAIEFSEEGEVTGETIWVMYEQKEGQEMDKEYTQDDLDRKVKDAVEAAKKETSQEFSEKVKGLEKDKGKLLEGEKARKIQGFVDAFTEKRIAPAVIERVKTLLQGTDDALVVEFSEKEKKPVLEMTVEIFSEVLETAIDEKLIVPEGEKAPGSDGVKFEEKKDKKEEKDEKEAVEAMTEGRVAKKD